MRVILVPVANRPECVRALKAAFDVAARFGADVIGCHIRTHRHGAVRIPGMRRVSELEWTVANAGRNLDRASRDAAALFKRAAATAGLPVARQPRADGSPVAIWYERVGSPDRVMPIVGPMADLLVVSRPVQKGGGRLGRMFLMSALLDSCRPVLLLPQRGVRRPARHVMIAWNQSPEASRAVAAGMSMLEAAETVSIAVAGSETAVGPKSSHLARYLAHHGIAAEVVRSPGRKPAEELEQSFRQSRADLLLMGAYSRHRFRERLFGGVSDYMLHHCALPLLVYHSHG